MCLRLIAETDTRSVGDSHYYPSCSLQLDTGHPVHCIQHSLSCYGADVLERCRGVIKGQERVASNQSP